MVVCFDRKFGEMLGAIQITIHVVHHIQKVHHTKPAHGISEKIGTVLALAL